MRTTMALFTKYKYIVFVIFCSLLASWPLTHAGLPPTHDGEYHLIRFYEFDKVLRSGVWYPRWAPDLDFGYGLPLFTYVYPLPNYMASFFHVFGASFLDSVKLNMFAASIVGAIFFYLWTKRFWGQMGAVISSILYTFSPYHFVDIYVRGSVGEVWALALFPAFLWAYTEFAKTKKLIYLLLSPIFLALIIFSHNILGLMFFAFVLTYITLLIFQSNQKKFIIYHSSFIILLGLGLSSIFWLPALLETKYVTGLQVYNVTQNFPDLFQLLFPSWGTGFFGTSLGNEMSVQIGLANLIALCIGIFAYIKFRKHAIALTLLFFILWFFVLVFFMLPYSLPVWKIIPLLNYFQFPWRLLSLVILVCSFLGGSIVYLKKSWIISGIFVVFAIFVTISYTQPAYYMMRSDKYYVSRSNFIDGTNSPGNTFNTIWNTPKTSRPRQLISIKDNRKIASVSYFPTWNVSIDGKQVSTTPTQGLLSFSALRNKKVVISIGQTRIESLGEFLSVVSFLYLLIKLLHYMVYGKITTRPTR